MIGRRELIGAALFSLLVHLLLLLSVRYLSSISTLPDPRPLELFLAQHDQKFDVADIAPPDKEEVPTHSKFLGQYNTATEQERVQNPQLNQLSKKSSSPKSERSDNPPKKLDGLASFDPDIFSMKSPEIPKKKGVREELRSGTEISEDMGKDKPFLPEEYFRDFQYGEHTYLNVLRHPDVEYFVRLRRVFRLTWNPISILKSHFLNHAITRGNVRVVVAVTVGKEGNLEELFVIQGSGISAYDREALRTVRASSPFATPPGKFLDKEGKLRMSWSFIVYL